MTQFRPYGGHDQRIISDLSRFDYETTPTKPITRTPSEVSSSKLTLDTIIPLYSSRIEEGHQRYSPLPTEPSEQDHVSLLEVIEQPVVPPVVPQVVRLRKVSVGVQVPQDNPDLIAPSPPPKDPPKQTMSQRQSLVNDLPEMPQPQAVQFQGDVTSLQDRQKQLEEDLIRQVMNRPLMKFKADRFGQDFQGQEITISANLFMYVFEVLFCIIEIVLGSVLLNNDFMISINIYRYFIADGVMGLIVSLLLIFQAITYEKRNGSFYCLATTIMKLVAFILVVAVVFPSADYATFQIWQIRRANGAFIIISMFLWATNLIMFVTTLYISRLNLLNELNFDYSDRGLDEKFNKRESVEKHEEDLKEFYLNENGEMFALTEDWEKEQYRGKNKILVYTF